MLYRCLAKNQIIVMNLEERIEHIYKETKESGL